MKLDQLPESEQETASYCFSCGEVRPEEQLHKCSVCGNPICGMEGCNSRCDCVDTGEEVIREIDSVLEALEKRSKAGEARTIRSFSTEEYNAVISLIDSFLELRGQPA